MNIDDLFPPGTRWFIAGGYAACPALAEDIDVWVWGVEIDVMAATRMRLLHHLKAINAKFKVEEETRNYKADYVGDDDCVIRKVAKVAAGEVGKLSIHLLITNGTVFDVLNTFDLSTHQVALCGANVVKGDDWTPVWHEPKVLKQTPTTQARYEKIIERYQIEGVDAYAKA